MKITRKNLKLEVNDKMVEFHYSNSDDRYNLLDVIKWLFAEELDKRGVDENFSILKFNYRKDQEDYSMETENLSINGYDFSDIVLEDLLYINQYTKKEQIIEKIKGARIKISEIIDRVLEMDYTVEA